MDQIVHLLAPGNPPSEVIGQATLTDLPQDRFPTDLQWLAPVIVVDGRTFLFLPNFTYGQEPTPTYVEVFPKTVQGTLALRAG